MPIQDAFDRVNRFRGDFVGDTIGALEDRLKGARVAQVCETSKAFNIDPDFLLAAAAVKRASAQIDVIIHAVGILWALPQILREDEVIESTSMGAGKAAAARFDLETNQRIAEFKFINWQGGAEAVRKQVLFQDFYRLVREPTHKRKELYLLNTEIPLVFLRGRSSAEGTLRRRNAALAEDYASHYGTRYKTVGQFYEAWGAEVKLVNLISEVDPRFSAFVGLPADEAEES